MKAWEKGKDGESSSEPARHVGGQLPVSSPDEAQRILRDYNIKKQLPQAESVVVWRVPAGSTQLFPFSGPSVEELVMPPY